MKKVYDPEKFASSAKIFETIMTVLFDFFVGAVSVFLLFGICAIASPWVLEKTLPVIKLIGFASTNATGVDVSHDLPLNVISFSTEVAIIIVLLFNLKKLLHTIIQKSPFDEANPRRIELIAWLIIGLQFALPIFSRIVSIIMSNHHVGWVFLFSFSQWAPLIAGLVLLMIAKIFRYGAYLQTEYDETL